MKTENYSASDLIYLFLDGEASAAQKAELFGEAAASPELQAEFYEAIEMHRAFAKDKRKAIPPAALTGAIFTTAGITAAYTSTAGAASAASGGFSGFISGVAAKLGAYIAAAGVGAALTVGGFLGYGALTSEDKRPAVESAKANSQASSPIEILYQKEEAKAEKATPFINNASQERVSSGASSAPILVFTGPDVSALKDMLENSDAKKEILVASIDRSGIETKYIVNERSAFMPESIIPTANFGGDDNQNSILNNLMFEIKGISGFSQFPYRYIAPTQKEVINNIAVSALYEINDNFALGISFGQEEFQMYRIKRLGSVTEYIIEPNLLWTAAELRAQFPELNLGPFFPYGIAAVGGSKYGPLGKFAAGLTYKANENVSFDLGLDFTGQAFVNNDKVKGAGKIGMNYSIIIRLK